MLLSKTEEKFNLKNDVSRVLLLIGKNLNLLVLVVIYAFTNTMQYQAVALIGAPIYAVVLQSKIFFTAGFSVLFLSRTYTFTKWRALILLVIGCLLVSSPILIPKVDVSPCDVVPASLNGNITSAPVSNTRRSLRGSSGTPHQVLILPHQVLIEDLGRTSFPVNNHHIWNTRQLLSNGTSPEEVSSFSKMLGLAMTLSIALCSGFSSVYFEKILKQEQIGTQSTITSSPTAIWDRNFQLAFYSIICTAVVSIFQYTVMKDTGDIDTEQQDYVLFAGWSWVTFTICIVNSIGGLLVAATLKYADAMMKCFATAVAIIMTSIIGYFFLDSEITMFSSLGMLTTILSILNYTLVEN